MYSDTIRVSFFTPDVGLAKAISSVLGEGFEIREAAHFTPEERPELGEWCDVVLLDLRIPATGEPSDDPFELMENIRKLNPPPPIVVLLPEEERDLALRFMEKGAYDSLSSPPNIMELRLTLRRAQRFSRLERELWEFRSQQPGPGRFHDLIGQSEKMQEVFALARKIAPCDVGVLITGETGTGKELLARAIHRSSPRASQPFVVFSCVNLPETLVEDELFGHEKGAYTGAIAFRRGRLEAADGGTLFLDEVGDLGLGLQPKFLRVLQERTVGRLGGNSSINVNLRVVCATNRNLTELIQQGKFREDLYYRLNVVPIHLPPLRERRDDIPVLAQALVERFAAQFGRKVKRFSRMALHAMEEYAWPGNVRELENVVQRGVALSEEDTLDLWHLPAAIRNGYNESLELTLSYEEEVRHFKRRLLLRTLQECGWRKAKSARTLGVARGYLHRLINQLEINEPKDIDAAPWKLPPGE